MVSLVKAASVIAVPDSPSLSPDGGELGITVEIAYQGQVNALGLELPLPKGWSVVDVSGPDYPGIRSSKRATGRLELPWMSAPQDGAKVGLKLAYPARATATALLGEVQILRENKRINFQLVVPLSR